MWRLTDEQLDEARQRGDSPADTVIAQLGPDAWTCAARLRHVYRNDAPLPATLPGAVLQLFDQHAQLPPWFDRRCARRAATFAERHLPAITVALFCASLPSAYAAARGSRVLATTGRMHGVALDQRVNETAQFVLDVLSPRAFEPDGCGLRSVQKVRLMHAAVRARFRPDWGEIAINQEDLLGTLGTFSVVVVRALRRLGLRVTAQEAEDFYQLWRGVGFALGIEPPLLPTNYDSAEELCDHIARRQVCSSQHGRDLFDALLVRLQDHSPLPRAVPHRLVRYLAGSPVADALGLAHTRELDDAAALLRWLPRPSALDALGREISALLGRPLLQSVVVYKLRGSVATFA